MPNASRCSGRLGQQCRLAHGSAAPARPRDSPGSSPRRRDLAGPRVRAMRARWPRYSGASHPSMSPTTSSVASTPRLPHDRDRVEQQIDALFRDDLADENHAAGNSGAVSRATRWSGATPCWESSRPFPRRSPCASSSRAREFGVGDEAIDERDDHASPENRVEPARRRRVAEPGRRRARRGPAATAAPESCAGPLSKSGTRTWVGRDAPRHPQQVPLTRSISTSILSDIRGSKRRRVSGYQYGPTDQLAPLASASGVIRKFSQPLTMLWPRAPDRCSTRRTSNVIRSSPPAITICPQHGDDPPRRVAPLRLGSRSNARITDRQARTSPAVIAS